MQKNNKKQNELSNNLFCEKEDNIINAFSIHTVEVRIKVSKQDYEYIIKGMLKSEDEGICFYSDEKGIMYMKSGLLRDRGINKFLFFIRDVEGCPKGYYITAVVNLRLLFHDLRYPFLCIARIGNLDYVDEKIVSILLEYGVPRRIVRQAYYSRVDYCCNVEFETEEQVDLMLNILDRGKVNRFYKKDCNELHKNEVRYDTKSFCFSMYKKGVQMKQKKDWYRRKYAEEEMEIADRVLRIEYRADRAQLYVLKDKYRINEKELITNAPIIGLLKFCTFYINLCGTGAFYKMKYAKKIINESNNTEKTKNTMIHIIQTVSRSGMIGIQSELGKDKLNYYMKKFNQLKISPLCIPTEFNCDEMNSLIWYMKHCNVNQRY